MEPDGFKIDLEEGVDEPETGGMLIDGPDMHRSRMPLFPLVIAFTAVFALIFFVYLNLGTRINAITKAGETRIKTVSTGVGDRLDAVSEKLGGLEKVLQKEIDELESRTKKNHADIRSLSKKIASLKKTTAGLGAIQKKLIRLDSSIKKIRAETDGDSIRVHNRLTAVDDTLKELKTSTDSISTQQDRIKELSFQIDALVKSSIDKKQINAVADAIKKEMEQRMDSADTRHAAELSKIRSELAGIKKTVSAFKRTATRDAAPVAAKAPAPATPVNGGIVEQEIK